MPTLPDIYHKLSHTFGPQHWWPGDTPFEIAVGAILTQNTNWGNVEKAIRNLKKQKSLSAKVLHEMPVGELAALIRPAGYFNIKTQRLKSFINFLVKEHHGSMKKMKSGETQLLREQLLSVNGIGPETADSILLYALEKPVFVIDAYTRRVLSRHHILDERRSYNEFQALFHDALGKNMQLFNEFHALFVQVGKTFCKRARPLCDSCPLSLF
jgi:endonuclease III related protein